MGGSRSGATWLTMTAHSRQFSFEICAFMDTQCMAFPVPLWQTSFDRKVLRVASAWLLRADDQ